MKPVRLKPTAPRSRVKHSTTEPLRSLIIILTLSSAADFGLYTGTAKHV